MTHGSTQDVVDAFIAGLKDAWAVAAPPSYAAVERLAQEIRSRPARPAGGPVIPLPAATVHDLLTRPRRRLPRWEMTASLLVVLREVAAARGEDPDRIGTLEQWKKRHEAALREVEAVRRRGRRKGGVGLAPGGPGPEELARRRAELESAQRATLLALAEGPGPRWWHPYRRAVPAEAAAYMTLEGRSHRLQIYEPGAVPDLLWTEEHARRRARAASPEAPEELADSAAGLLLQRRLMLVRDDPVRLWVLLDEEAVLPSGDPDRWREQVEHLLALAALPNVSLQIRPSGAEAGPIGAAARLLRFRETDLPDVICLQQGERMLFPADSSVVHHYTALLKAQFFSAATPETSLQILRELLNRH